MSPDVYHLIDRGVSFHLLYLLSQQVIGIVTEVSSYILPPSASRAGGRGGGGDRDKLRASKGILPRFSREQLAPPVVVIRNENP
jgi:hypothetical protein